jgi:hypothetical protein
MNKLFTMFVCFMGTIICTIWLVVLIITRCNPIFTVITFGFVLFNFKNELNDWLHVCRIMKSLKEERWNG